MKLKKISPVGLAGPRGAGGLYAEALLEQAQTICSHRYHFLLVKSFTGVQGAVFQKSPLAAGGMMKKKLENIEKQKNITILFACESGSRAWGFASPDSDFDIRFIYSQPTNDYLSIENKKDIIEIPISNDLDIAGWDIRKALKLLYNSNAVIFEWLQSPIIYRSLNHFKEDLFQLSREYFSPRASMHHYLGLSKKSLSSGLEGDQIKIKSYFYVLRPLLAAMWIAKYNEIPPMEFRCLTKLIENRKTLVQKIEMLLKEKAAALEGEKTGAVPEIQDFIAVESVRCKEIAARLPSKRGDIEKLNIFFRSLILPQ